MWGLSAGLLAGFSVFELGWVDLRIWVMVWLVGCLYGCSGLSCADEWEGMGKQGRAGQGRVMCVPPRVVGLGKRRRRRRRRRGRRALWLIFACRFLLIRHRGSSSFLGLIVSYPSGNGRHGSGIRGSKDIGSVGGAGYLG
ncbi:uncharacterized protein BO72DRAFT_302739 [Aspergillus fijiensis CBS 313.89]|uniref:Uncharacterized protein n=1 Tax=Aspergillus fijiensis CBS 313.89 TaxID=1448319 RepID=A0A8G1RWU5_9EURO|nr:uncharacterized protein BO72DRAFT_302739 [Aspergillus fijiensis CBS 313.89]RAK80354.1 hypothetical protein BO72DRAFT_302739 [Aspergillus fijiensis CBS 313.89]